MTIEEFEKLPISAQQILIETAAIILAKSTSKDEVSFLLHLAREECEECTNLFVEFFTEFLGTNFLLSFLDIAQYVLTVPKLNLQ